MPFTQPGTKVWENTVPLTTALSPLVTGWFETTGYTNIVLSYVFTSGTTVMTIEGSFDGSTLDSSMTYAALAASPQTALVVPVMHTFIRFRIVQTIANATVTTAYAQARL